jgi:hypothetical protein
MTPKVGEEYMLKYWVYPHPIVHIKITAVKCEGDDIWAEAVEDINRFVLKGASINFDKTEILIPLEVWNSPLYNALRENENE